MFQDQPSFSERLKRNNNLTKKNYYIYLCKQQNCTVCHITFKKCSRVVLHFQQVFKHKFSFRYFMATITSLDFERDILKLFCRCNPTIMIPKIHSQLQSKLFRKLPINLGKIKNMQVFIQMLQILFMILKNACMVFNFIVQKTMN